MTNLKLCALLATLSLAASLTSPSFADGKAVGKTLQDQAALAGEESVGAYISGTIYGNTSNPSGNGNGVLPSLSPGPWKCTVPTDCAGPTTAGGSMGEFISPLTSGGNSSADFANGGKGVGTGPDFSDQ
jgi:hypothetical protein